MKLDHHILQVINIFVNLRRWIIRSFITAMPYRLRFWTCPIRWRRDISCSLDVVLGPNLGGPHTKAFGEGLFELRLKGAEGIARVFFCTLVGKRIVILHSFIKKSDKTPPREREIAEVRMKEVTHAHT